MKIGKRKLKEAAFVGGFGSSHLRASFILHCLSIMHALKACQFERLQDLGFNAALKMSALIVSAAYIQMHFRILLPW